jgi:TIR domain
MSRILLSYRRADTGIITGRIFDRLVQHFGKDAVFMDIDNIPFGLDFREHLNVELAKCEIVVAVVGHNWLGAGAGGVNRIDDETDFVRIEVEAALSRNIPVIPLLVDRAPMPKASQLSQTLKTFTFRNAAEVDTGRDFHSHMDRLIRAINQLLGQRQDQSHGISHRNVKSVSARVAAFPLEVWRQGLFPYILITVAAMIGLVSYAGPSYSDRTLSTVVAVILAVSAPLIAGFLLSLRGRRIWQTLEAGLAIAAILAVLLASRHMWMRSAPPPAGELAFFVAAVVIWTLVTMVVGDLLGRGLRWLFWLFRPRTKMN